VLIVSYALAAGVVTIVYVTSAALLCDDTAASRGAAVTHPYRWQAHECNIVRSAKSGTLSLRYHGHSPLSSTQLSEAAQAC